MEPKQKPDKKPKHVHRMISLPPELDAKASSMENFSAYVRRSLEEVEVNRMALMDALKRSIVHLKECLRTARDKPKSNEWATLVENEGWLWEVEE